ncbi:MAG: c-type cytochrome [Gammaproteobacteria bacterium]
MRALLIGISLLVCAWATPPAFAQQLNPFEGDAAAVTAGGALFAGRCADCHGADAKGSRGPDLTQRWAAGATAESTFAMIRRGVPGSIMPPSAAPDHELWAIVAWLRNISVAPQLVSSGDAARGRALFAAQCQQCHRVGAKGGALGPDLTFIGLTRSREALVTALRNPSASVPAGFRAVDLVNRGERIEGVIKSEDAFSIQVLTVDGRLLGLRKAALGTIAPRSESLMPAFSADKLGEFQLEDLLAYLGTLRETGTGAK